MSNNLFSAIQTRLLDNPSKATLVMGDGSVMTALELEQASRVMGAVLVSLGVQPGDRVSAQIEKSWTNVALYLATLRVGGVYLPLNSAYTDAEIDYFLSDATPKLHVCVDARKAAAQESLAKLGSGKVESLHGESGSLWDAYVAAQSASNSFDQVVERTSTDLASLLYTSGTTGKPKGAMISHGNLLANAQMLAEAWAYSSDDVLLHALPLFHIHGLFVGLNLALVAGGSIILLEKYDAKEVMKQLPAATVMMGVPTYYTRLLAEESFDRDVAGHMRLFISGSAPLLVETSNEFYERTGQRILERYGMTESGMTCSNPLNGERRAGSVGPALPGVETRIVTEDGELAKVDEIGILEVRGANIFQGYWNLPEKTASEFKGDWFITGDMATKSKDGYISIVGRGKDLIITGGLNVYPKEIEDTINEMDGVVESAVVGVPHADFGEGIVAVVVGSSNLDLGQLQTKCRELLASFKVPKKWVQVDALPRNTMGKVQKNLLRDEYNDAYK